jgi:hypothetical protein
MLRSRLVTIRRMRRGILVLRLSHTRMVTGLASLFGFESCSKVMYLYDAVFTPHL